MKKQTKKILSLGFGIFIGLVLAEILIRIVGFGGDAFSYKEIKSFVGLGRSGIYQASDPAVVGAAFNMKPNTTVYNKMSTVSSNSLGFRSPETTVEKAPGVFRICVLGDSFTMGDGVEEPESYSRQLDSILNNSGSGQTFEVINMGVGGYNLIEYQSIFEKQLPAYDPDLVVIGFCGRNDMNVPADWRTQSGYKPKTVQNGFWRSYLAFFVKQNIIEPRRRGEPYNAEQQSWVDQSFEHISQTSAVLDIPVLIYYLSIVDVPEYSSIIEKTAEKYQLPFSTTINDFRELNPNDYSLNLFDGHPNPEAHHLFAERLAKDLLQNKLLETPAPEDIEALFVE